MDYVVLDARPSAGLACASQLEKRMPTRARWRWVVRSEALDEAVLMGEGDCFCSRVDSKLGVDVGDVARRGRGADEERLADLAVAVSRDEQPQHLQLALGQAVRGGATPGGASRSLSR